MLSSSGKSLRRYLKILAASLIISCFIYKPANAQEPNIKNVTIITQNDRLLVRIKLEHAFSSVISDAIINGIKVSFAFTIVIVQVNDFWLDNNIVELQVENTINYDSLRKEFVIDRPWQREAGLVTKSYEKAKSLMTEVDDLEVASLARFQRGRKYQLRVKAELDKMELHPILEYFSFVFPQWNFETDWYIIDFTY